MIRIIKKLYNAILFFIKTKTFSCPRCGALVPKVKSLYMTRSTKIRCKGCSAYFGPDRKMASIIGSISAGIYGGIFAVVNTYVMNSVGLLVKVILYLVLLTLVLIFVIKYLYIAKSPKIKSKKRDTNLSFDSEAMPILGVFIGVGIGIGCFIGNYVTDSGNWFVGGLLLLLFTILITVVGSYYKIKHAKFIELPEAQNV